MSLNHFPLCRNECVKWVNPLKQHGDAFVLDSLHTNLKRGSLNKSYFIRRPHPVLAKERTKAKQLAGSQQGMRIGTTPINHPAWFPLRGPTVRQQEKYNGVFNRVAS